MPFFWLWTAEDGSRVCWISLASVGSGGSEAAQHLLLPHFVFQPIWGGAILPFINFFNQISHHKESEISDIFSPT
jgi:hypothetical protein